MTPTSSSMEALRASFLNYLKARGLTARENRHLLDQSPLAVYTDPDVPFVVYYPVTDEMDLDPVMWKSGAGRSRTTIQ